MTRKISIPVTISLNQKTIDILNTLREDPYFNFSAFVRQALKAEIAQD